MRCLGRAEPIERLRTSCGVKAKVNETNKIFRVNGVVRSREKKGKKIQKKAKKRLDRADIVRDAW
jgi:hypothetical protein